MEREQMTAWQASRPGDRIVEVDIPLSYGIYDVVQDQYLLNTVEFLWDPTKEVGVYIKVCTVLSAFIIALSLNNELEGILVKDKCVFNQCQP
jgi:transcription factor CP2-like protein